MPEAEKVTWGRRSTSGGGVDLLLPYIKIKTINNSTLLIKEIKTREEKREKYIVS